MRRDTLRAVVELIPHEVADLRAKVALQSIQASHSGAPVVNLSVVGGPLDGVAITMADDARCQGLVCWRVERGSAAVDVAHRREGDVLKYTSLVTLS